VTSTVALSYSVFTGHSTRQPKEERHVVLQFWLSAVLCQSIATGGDSHHGACHLRRDGRGLAHPRPPSRGTDERDPQGRVLRQPAVCELTPARIARRDTAEDLARLTQEPGGEIIAHGGTQFARSLIRLGPGGRVPAKGAAGRSGQGALLFTGLARPVTLSLIKTTPFPSGILELCYVPVSYGA
jgi:hypothetical protein